MSTWSLLLWVALVAGAELAVRGHLAGRVGICHAGTALCALALAALAWPTRARRAGGIAAGALLVVAALDAGVAVARRGEPARDAVVDLARPTPDGGREIARDAPPLAADGLRILAFGGSTTAGLAPDTASAWPARLEARLRERLRCRGRIDVINAGRADASLGGGAAALADRLDALHPAWVLVLAGPEVLDEVLDEAPALRLPEPARRGSPLGAAIERALASRRARSLLAGGSAAAPALDPRRSRLAARYRELVLGARRAGAEVALVIPPLAPASETGPSHRWVLAAHAHAQLVRAVAGAYATKVIDPRAALTDAPSGVFRGAAHLAPTGEARLAGAVADALAPLLKSSATGCTPRTTASTADPTPRQVERGEPRAERGAAERSRTAGSAIAAAARVHPPGSAGTSPPDASGGNLARIAST